MGCSLNWRSATHVQQLKHMHMKVWNTWLLRNERGLHQHVSEGASYLFQPLHVHPISRPMPRLALKRYDPHLATSCSFATMHLASDMSNKRAIHLHSSSSPTSRSRPSSTLRIQNFWKASNNSTCSARPKENGPTASNIFSSSCPAWRIQQLRSTTTFQATTTYLGWSKVQGPA